MYDSGVDSSGPAVRGVRDMCPGSSFQSHFQWLPRLLVSSRGGWKFCSKSDFLLFQEQFLTFWLKTSGFGYKSQPSFKLFFWKCSVMSQLLLNHRYVNYVRNSHTCDLAKVGSSQSIFKKKVWKRAVTCTQNHLSWVKKLKIAPGTIENLILGKIFNHPYCSVSFRCLSSLILCDIIMPRI